MDSLWIVYGWFMDGLWLVYGQLMGSLWVVYGYFMVILWLGYEQFMDSFHGKCMVLTQANNDEPRGADLSSRQEKGRQIGHAAQSTACTGNQESIHVTNVI